MTHDMSPEVVYDGTEGEAVPPAAVHVQDVHVVVGGSHAPAPDLTHNTIRKYLSATKIS